MFEITDRAILQTSSYSLPQPHLPIDPCTLYPSSQGIFHPRSDTVVGHKTKSLRRFFIAQSQAILIVREATNYTPDELHA